MAVIKIGNTTGAIYQVEQPIHLNPDGSAQASLTYKCTVESPYAVIPEYLTPHPYLPALLCYESDLDYEPGGIIRITSIYRGILADNPEELAQYEFSRTLTEAPIETNPKYSIPRDDPPVTAADLNAIELAIQNCTPINSSLSAAAKNLYDKKRRGIDSFLRPGAIFKKTYASETIPTAILDDVGKVVNPGAPAPDAPSDQNYLLMGVSWTKQAGLITVVEEYQLSGPGGWDPDLYPTA
jgi:hypothetical protein